MKSFFASALAVAGLAVRTVCAEDIDSNLGAAGFLFPTEREYSAAADQTAPCGSVAQVGNRTDFPITGGFVGLVDQEEAYYVSVSISYNSNPTSLDQFETLIASTRIKDLYEGHTCVSIPNPPSNISVGDVATLQVAFQAVWDGSTKNETYYACADIVYILDADFTENDYCFNATIGGPTTTAATTAATATSTSGSSSGSSGSSGSSSSSTSGSSSSSKGISKGAIAGAVVGSVLGAALLAGAAWFVYRLGKKHQRENMMRAHMNNMALGDMGKPAATGSQASNY
ncbi:hypothetical protein SEUCBS139899_008481 [Sporothrix eucalyptigena]|uniref:Copper acquisition factor BIM1-like domain-containing protein n=1 Tax=Sporothrix eucalyptigena TaxID=1812306 RepID=A0ABP0C9J0_9PEZI